MCVFASVILHTSIYGRMSVCLHARERVFMELYGKNWVSDINIIIV